MDNYWKWQYKVENELYLTEEKLTQLGAKGWELVAIHGEKAYFKRNKLEEVPAIRFLTADGEVLTVK